MKEIELVIQNLTGLHARPAKIFVNTAKQFNSKIQVKHNGKKANAKSLIAMLALGVKPGGLIQINVEGDDEELALAELTAAVENGLGEEEHTTAEANGTATPAAIPATGSNIIRGIAAAPGIAIGPVFQWRPPQTKAVALAPSSGATVEKERLTTALALAERQIAALAAEMEKRTGAEEAAIFDAHRELLQDPDLLEAVQTRIDAGESAAAAWQAATTAQAEIMAGLDNPLLAARAADLRDVGGRVFGLLLGETTAAPTLPNHPVVLVAEDLSPSDTAALDKSRVLGFGTAAGGPTAHSAIIARALGIPAVVSAGEALLRLADGTPVILDGSAGRVHIDPDAEALAKAKVAQGAARAAAEAAAAMSADPAITRDGHRVEVVANVGGAAEAQQAFEAGAEGVGLLRTEFLFLKREEPPGDEEQYEVYRDIVMALGGQPVIARTLDIGGDKPLPYIKVEPEANPFLGERGIRLCLARPELLEQQVRALLRAAAHGPIRIMFPMVSDVSEFRAARALVQRIAAEMGAPQVELGIMVEVPSAALMADAFARDADFFSIGTNDLTQYTLAIDRMHPSLARMADGLHPAVLRLIAETVRGAKRAGKWVGVCGELGSDVQAVPILVGLGVAELSVTVPAVARVKAQIRELNLAEAEQLAARALACATAAEVRALTQ